jgi:hypothetical protein
MRFVKVGIIVVAALWGSFITWQAYLAHVEAREACSNTLEILDRLGEPSGYDRDVLLSCR